MKLTISDEHHKAALAKVTSKTTFDEHVVDLLVGKKFRHKTDNSEWEIVGRARPVDFQSATPEVPLAAVMGGFFFLGKRIGANDPTPVLVGIGEDDLKDMEWFE